MTADKVADLFEAGIISAHEAFVKTSNAISARMRKEQR